MKICFITDHPFYEEDGTFYSGGGIPADMLKRYVRGDSKLVVLGRKSVKKNLTLSSIPNSDFHFLVNYAKPQDVFVKRKALLSELETYISQADGVVLRVPTPLCLMAYKVCRKLHKNCSVEVCGSAYDAFYNYGSLIGKIAAPISEHLHKRMIRDADFVLYVTQNYLQGVYPHKDMATTVACSNVALPTIPANTLSDRLSKISKHNSSTYVFGQIGNVSVAYKGYDVMIKALSLLKGCGYDVKYKIVGAGNPEYLMSQAKEAGVEDQVVAVGRMDHDRISEFLKDIDVYVHPSFQEGVPRAVVEAISFAVPCVVSNVAGTGELVNKKWLHKPGDFRKLANDIIIMLSDNKQMLNAAKENFERAKDYYPDVLNSRRNRYYDIFFDSLIL